MDDVRTNENWANKGFNMCLEGNRCTIRPTWQEINAVICSNRGEETQNITTREQCLQSKTLCENNDDETCNFISWRPDSNICSAFSSCLLGPSLNPNDFVLRKTAVTLFNHDIETTTTATTTIVTTTIITTRLTTEEQTTREQTTLSFGTETIKRNVFKTNFAAVSD